MTVMRYSMAVDRLRTIADLPRLASLWEDDPLVVGAYVFGELLEGSQRPERLQLAFVVDLPPDEVTWCPQPPRWPASPPPSASTSPLRVVFAAGALAGLEPPDPWSGAVLVAGRARRDSAGRPR